MEGNSKPVQLIKGRIDVNQNVKIISAPRTQMTRSQLTDIFIRAIPVLNQMSGAPSSEAAGKRRR